MILGGANGDRTRCESIPTHDLSIRPLSHSEKLNGGAERDRTVDLLNAIQALSQLSYSPT
jgi:hypothetical protein